jgi:hypothetical protein
MAILKVNHRTSYRYSQSVECCAAIAEGPRRRWTRSRGGTNIHAAGNGGQQHPATADDAPERASEWILLQLNTILPV